MSADPMPESHQPFGFAWQLNDVLDLVVSENARVEDVALAELDRLRAEHHGWATVVHDLKCWPEYFNAIGRGEKTCELRRDDRAPGFRVGDDLVLREWSPTSGYTGAYLVRRVTHVLRDAESFGLGPGFALLSLEARP